jgi:hypothetical protein
LHDNESADNHDDYDNNEEDECQFGSVDQQQPVVGPDHDEGERTALI